MEFKDAVLQALLSALGKDQDAAPLVQAQLGPPPRVELGDLAFGCFALAKELRKAPPAIAQELAGRIVVGGQIARVEAAGPYVNFFLDASGVLKGLARGLADGSHDVRLRAATARRVMIEFSQPNTHKVFHVGHLRNVFLGDSLVRVFRARGHDVVAANYYGDFGIDVAKCLWWLSTHPDEQPPERGRTAWLGRAYTQATLLLEELRESDPERGRKLHAEVRDVLRAMEEQEPRTDALYRETRAWCLDEFRRIYQEFDVRFDVEFYESQLEAAGQRVVDEYLAKGVLVESQGAIICDLESEGLGAALVRKTDGASLYLTWDLALAREKFERYDIQQSIYVVGSEQTLHFKQLFATLARMGYERAKDCRHVAYELVMLPSGKMSSRKGTAIPMADLRDAVVRSVHGRMAGAFQARSQGSEDAAIAAGTREGAAGEILQDPLALGDPPGEIDVVVRRIANACLRYGMLGVGTNRRVVFDIDEWTNPEGDTGAYLLYVLARIQGIFGKVGVEPSLVDAEVAQGALKEEAERALLSHLLKLGDVVARVEEALDPSYLAHYLFDGAKCFSRFYQECPVLKAQEPVRTARLVLLKATQAVFEKGLDLLGIVPVRSM